MSFRAVILGLLGAAGIAAFGYVNDELLRLNLLVGNHFPVSVFGLLVVAMAAVNPLLYLARPSWRLRTGEVAVVLTFVLAACSVPSSGLMRTFTPSLVLPIQMSRRNPGWRKNKLLSYVPAAMLAGRGEMSREVVGDFLSGKAPPGGTIGLDAVPWRAWAEPLTLWMPLVLLCMLGAVGLALLVHRQWASRERLRYPIASIASLLIETPRGRAAASVFRSRMFWLALGAILAIRVVNGLAAWYPNMIEVKLSFNFWPAVTGTYPQIAKLSNAWAVLLCQLFPTVIAFSYFLATDVSFSLGISKAAWLVLSGLCLAWGVDLSGGYFAGGRGAWLTFGAYFGLAVVLLYTGRAYYGRVIKAAVLCRREAGVERSAVWGARVFILCSAGMVAILMCLGLDLLLAALTVVLLFLMFLVMARISAETGLFFIQTSWQAFAVIVALFGAAALGPKAMIVLALVTVVLAVDPRECLLPFVVNALKVCDDSRVRPSRAAATAGAAVAVALAVAVPVVLWTNYNHGVQTTDEWATQSVPAFPFEAVGKHVTELKLAGRLEESLEVGGLGRLAAIRPARRFLWSVGVGLALVIVCSAARLRLPWWPIHPVLFLVWYPNPLNHFAWSFFIGWMIKKAVTRLGGARAYERGKSLMVGAIAGDLLGGLTFMVVGLVHYLLRGAPGPVYRILPM